MLMSLILGYHLLLVSQICQRYCRLMMLKLVPHGCLCLDDIYPYKRSCT